MKSLFVMLTMIFIISNLLLFFSDFCTNLENSKSKHVIMGRVISQFAILNF